MPWHKRDKALVQARRYVALLSDTFLPMHTYKRTRLSEQAKAEKAGKVTDWAARVRSEAQALQSVTAPDPDAAAHWQLLKEEVWSWSYGSRDLKA